MCELLAMSSRRSTPLAFSSETLAAHGGRTARNRDGWGAAFYQDNDVALFREPTAAGDSPLVRVLETYGPSTTLAISHIRRATRGAVAFSNTQPFRSKTSKDSTGTGCQAASVISGTYISSSLMPPCTPIWTWRFSFGSQSLSVRLSFMTSV
jgi:hypothetical protein